MLIETVLLLNFMTLTAQGNVQFEVSHCCAATVGMCSSYPSTIRGVMPIQLARKGEFNNALAQMIKECNAFFALPPDERPEKTPFTKELAFPGIFSKGSA